MKKRLARTALMTCLFVVFFVSGALAAWESNSATVNKISVASVKGAIEETYEQGQTVLPGETATKVVNVKNTGTIDSIVRIRVEKYWGSQRDSNGALVIEPALSTDNIQIAFDTVDWYYDSSDGYYYYRHVLNPSKTTRTPLFSSFSIAKDTSNLYKDMKADIRVSMECLQAGGNAVSVWNKTMKDLGVEYTAPSVAHTGTAISFISPEKAFRFDAKDGDLFADFKNLIPGESVSQTITVTNEYAQNAKIYLCADITDQPQATDKTRELIQKLLKEYAVISIRDEQGTVLYQGPVWGNLNSDGTGLTMKSPIQLADFHPGQNKKYTVNLSLDPRVDNQYEELLGLVKWVFYANGSESSIGGVPKTGDNSRMEMYLDLMAVSGGLILLSEIKRRVARRRRKNSLQPNDAV